jgi:hypothetical protein
MRTVEMNDYRIARLVDELFSAHQHGGICQNPVTGGSYVHGEDPVEPQKMLARRALLAREWFAEYGPADVQPLPLSDGEREDLKRGGILHILAWYARSLEARDYNVQQHPSFEDYARGVMASAPGFICNDERLRKRFPPRPLEWLNNAMVWEPPRAWKRNWRKKTRAAAKARRRENEYVVSG